MGEWNYWPGGSLGSPHTSQNSSSALTILRPPQQTQLPPGSLPSSPVEMGASTLSWRQPNASTTWQWLRKYIATATSTVSRLSSPMSSTGSLMPLPPSAMASTRVDVAWSGPRSPSFYSTCRTACPSPLPSPPPSMSSEDAVETLIDFMSMMEHLPRGGVVSPPAPGTNWADWLNALGREMYLHRVLEKLNAEYPPESDCDFLTHRAPRADGSNSS
jgi:hypothetical protein